MVKKSTQLLICSLILLQLAGCWDNIPIEERGFVVGMALDIKDGKTDGNTELTMTSQFVVPPALGTATERGSTGNVAFINLSASGDSVYTMDTEMAALTSKIPFFEHVKILVVSEELASTPHLFSNIFDIFVRDKEMRRGVKVIVAGDEAKEILDFKPKNAKLPAVFINDMLENSLIKTGLFNPILVGEIHEFLLKDNSFTIPKLVRDKGRVKYDGSAVFHGFKDRMVGTLNREDMTALNLMLGNMRGGTLEFKYKGDIITFRVDNAKGKTTEIDVNNPENLKFKINIRIEGGIVEVFGNTNLSRKKHIKGIEKAAAKKAEEIVNALIEKSQKELQAEIFDFDNQIRERHYDTWQKIKNDWDHGENYFAKSDFDVKAKAEIRTTGASNKSKSNRKE